MKKVIHTVNVRYGSYYQEGVKVYCNADDDTDMVKSRVKKQLDLNFLPMASFGIDITNTRYIEEYED